MPTVVWCKCDLDDSTVCGEWCCLWAYAVVESGFSIFVYDTWMILSLGWNKLFDHQTCGNWNTWTKCCTWWILCDINLSMKSIIWKSPAYSQMPFLLTSFANLFSCMQQENENFEVLSDTKWPWLYNTKQFRLFNFERHRHMVYEVAKKQK